jgi:hypothetical protein
MNWEAIGSIAEAAGVILVLVSILYLAVQVKQNTNAVKGASHHAVTDTFNAVSTLIAQNTEMARLYRLGNKGLENLTEDEQTSYGFLVLMYMRVFETIYYQQKMGTMTKELYLAEEQTLKWTFSKPGMREWWESNPISFSLEYREYIASLIREIETPPLNVNKSESR